MKLAFIASQSPKARRALNKLIARYGQCDAEQADVIVVLGGDGFMLHVLHQYMDSPLPVFGLRCGTVGFLLNEFRHDDLPERIEKASLTRLHPLMMTAQTQNGEAHTALAINEVSLFRQTKQSAHIEVSINGQVKLKNLIGDGIMVATPAGSTAYNLSVNGPVIPLGSQILALTPISPFRPRRWKGAVLPAAAQVSFRVLESKKRPVSATADNDEVRNVTAVDVMENKGIDINVLFDPEHNLEDRIINEQFIS